MVRLLPWMRTVAMPLTGSRITSPMRTAPPLTSNRTTLRAPILSSSLLAVEERKARENLTLGFAGSSAADAD